MNDMAPTLLAILKKRILARARRQLAGFSLVELMVACAILAAMMGLISVAIRQMAGGIKTSTAKVDAFQSARTGFESVSRTLGVASLNTYWDYFDSDRKPRGTNTNFTPATYGRQSDLHFLITNNFPTVSGLELSGHSVFFQAPLGYFTNTSSTNPPGSLNPCGFFVAYGEDPTMPNVGISNRPRFRLYQWLPSSDSMTVTLSSGRITNTNWISPATNNGVRPLAENIIAFVIRVPSATNSTGPAMNSTTYSTTATNYNWNSLTTWSTGSQPAQMHQLPPLVNITMVAVEEAAVNRLAGTINNPADAASAMGINNFSTLFTDEAQYDADLLRLETALSSKNIPYRTFTTTVPLRGSRWSP
jgi:uncharacterized protein (TIGR02599 family)